MPRLELPPHKQEFSVTEAAAVLGVSSEELRSLLVRHVLDDPESIRNIGKMRFRPADLIMLSSVVPGANGAN